MNLYSYLKTTVRKIIELKGGILPDWLKINPVSHVILIGCPDGAAISFVEGVEVFIDSTVPAGSIRYSINGIESTVTISGTLDKPNILWSDTNREGGVEADVSIWLNGKVTRS